jgi:uncharacterized membrane protein YeiH
MPATPFQLPIEFDLVAVFLFGLTGVWAATRRGYDVVGAFVLAFVTGTGGGILRDAVFLQQVPLVMQDRRYVWAILLSVLVGAIISRVAGRLEALLHVVDALGIGVYGVYGVNRALIAGLPPVAALVVGVCNAVGGGLLRDVLVREEPMLLKPSQLYAVAALSGCVVFVGLSQLRGLGVQTSAWISILLTVGVRLLALRFNWTTSVFGRRRVPGPG